MNRQFRAGTCFFAPESGGDFGTKGHKLASNEQHFSAEPISQDLQQVRRDVENLILQFEQIADVVEKIEYEGQSINVREFFQRAISRYQLEREENTLLQLPPKPNLPPINLSGTKVITVEDNEDISTLLTMILEAAGAEVVGVSSAHRALEFLEQSSFSVVVSDIGLPQMNGLEFVRRLRERGDLTPAIALSAYSTAKDEQAALDVGFDLYLSKPVHPAKLVMGIAQFVTNIS